MPIRECFRADVYRASSEVNGFVLSVEVVRSFVEASPVQFPLVTTFACALVHSLALRDPCPSDDPDIRWAHGTVQGAGTA